MALQQPVYVNPTTPSVQQIMSPSADWTQLAKFIATGLNGVAFDAGSNSLVNLATPVNATDGSNKGYVDTAISALQTLITNTLSRLSSKTSAVIQFGSQQTLSGLPTAQGVTLTAGQRVAVVGNTNPVENGLYTVASGAWTRTSDLAVGSSAAGSYYYVEQGTYAGQQWAVMSAPGSDVVGTNSLALSIIQATPSGLSVNGTGQYGLSYQGGVISIVTGAGLAQPNGGLAVQVDGNAVQVNSSNQVGLVIAANQALSAPNNQGLALATQANVLSQAGGTLSLIGLPATNGLNMLYQNNYADSVHRHAYNRWTGTADNAAISAGAPVYINANGKLAPSDAGQASTAIVIGFAAAAIAANATGDYLTSGVSQGSLSSATAGAPQFLAVGGGFTQTPPTASGQVILKVGYAASAADLNIQIGTATVRS